MIDLTSFSRGILRLATGLRQTLDEATVEVYFEAMRERTNPEEWEAFTKAAAVAPPWYRDGRAWFPQLVELLDALREFRGSPALAAEAVTMYEKVLNSGTYYPETGTQWVYRDIKAKCGEAAAEAFLEAGGHNAFAVVYGEDKRREKFLKAYQEAVRTEASQRAIGSGEVLKLKDGK